MTKSKPYVQFSKKIVTAVTACVTVISLVGVILCYAGNGLKELQSVVEVYIRYAMVVFVAYSGNSAMEKWLLKRAGVSHDDEEKENEVKG